MDISKLRSTEIREKVTSELNIQLREHKMNGSVVLLQLSKFNRTIQCQYNLCVMHPKKGNMDDYG